MKSFAFFTCSRSPTCCWAWEDITESEHRVGGFSSADVYNQSGAVTGNWGNLLSGRITLGGVACCYCYTNHILLQWHLQLK